MGWIGHTLSTPFFRSTTVFLAVKMTPYIIQVVCNFGSLPVVSLCQYISRLLLLPISSLFSLSQIDLDWKSPYLIMNSSLYLRTAFQELGLSSLFLGHASVCAILAFFTFLFVPETRGKTLTELCSIYEWNSWAIWWYFRKWPAWFHHCDMHIWCRG